MTSSRYLLVVLGAVGTVACMPVRKGPANGAAPTGEPVWVKATTERISYTVKEKVGETVHRDASGAVVGTSDSYQDRQETAEYTYWYPMQGNQQLSDEDFFRITDDEQAFAETREERESARGWRGAGKYMMIGGGVGLVASWLIPSDTSTLAYSLSSVSILTALGGYYAYYYGTARLAPEVHFVDMQRAVYSAEQYNRNAGLDAPAVMHDDGKGTQAGRSVGVQYGGSF